MCINLIVKQSVMSQNQSLRCWVYKESQCFVQPSPWYLVIGSNIRTINNLMSLSLLLPRHPSTTSRNLQEIFTTPMFSKVNYCFTILLSFNMMLFYHCSLSRTQGYQCCLHGFEVWATSTPSDPSPPGNVWYESTSISRGILQLYAEAA